MGQHWGDVMTFPILMAIINTVFLGVLVAMLVGMKEKESDYVGVAIFLFSLFCGSAFSTLQLLGWIVVK